MLVEPRFIYLLFFFFTFSILVGLVNSARDPEKTQMPAAGRYPNLEHLQQVWYLGFLAKIWRVYALFMLQQAR